MIAELFLRKTQAVQVAPIFNKFIRRFPDAKRLATARTEVVLSAVWSLGLPARAKQLRAMAAQLVQHHGGRIPRDERALRRLSGVGRYVANAVLCFAYDQRRPVVDANVIRLVQRYFGFRSARRRPREDEALWNFCASLLPRTRVREFNWALFDFAALVCSARDPSCGRCPLLTACAWPGKLSRVRNDRQKKVR